MSVFAAIADPVRRRIVVLLSGAPMTAGRIAAEFDISRPAVSRHLRVLRESGLVEADRGGADREGRERGEADGRERTYVLRPGALDEVDDWLARVRGPARLAGLLASPALDTEVHRARRDHAREAETDESTSTPERGTA